MFAKLKAQFFLKTDSQIYRRRVVARRSGIHFPAAPAFAQLRPPGPSKRPARKRRNFRSPDETRNPAAAQNLRSARAKHHGHRETR